jgi:hypothetical protein
MNCIEEDCSESPMNFHLIATLSDTSSVLNLGDTLKMYIPIPNVIETNYGDFEVEAINSRKSWFDVGFVFFDSLVENGRYVASSPINDIYFLIDGKYKQREYRFDSYRKMAEVHFIPSKKGKYYIHSDQNRTPLIFKEKGADWYSSMFTLGLDIEVKNQHQDLYLSWILNLEERVSASHGLRDLNRVGLFTYAFEVK